MASNAQAIEDSGPMNVKQVRFSRTAIAIDFESSAEYIAVSLDDKTVQVFDLSGRLLQTFAHKSIVRSLALRDDTLLCGQADGEVRAWDIANESVKADASMFLFTL